MVTIEEAVSPPPRRPCSDRFEECRNHAEDCSSNPGWMAVNCPDTCNYCHLRLSSDRCSRTGFLNVSNDAFLKPGDVTKIFKRIIAASSSSSSSSSATGAAAITVALSESEQGAEGEPSLITNVGTDIDKKIEKFIFNTEVLSQKPYILKFTNFLSESESNEILDYSGISYERSTGSSKNANELGEVNKVIDNIRTGASYWCKDLGCKSRDIVKKISDRISSLGSGINNGNVLPPRENWEPFQLLKYEVGEYYRSHHDYSADEIGLACGPRIFTFFVYLSDVIEGGNTSFPLTSANVSVMPKKGDAVLWSNVESKRPFSKDLRTTHEANTVTKGAKFAMNIWMHMYNFEVSNKWACCG
jgi:hypothetical protein